MLLVKRTLAISGKETDYCYLKRYLARVWTLVSGFFVGEGNTRRNIINIGSRLYIGH